MRERFQCLAKRHQTSGFTLIEMLVVIGVLCLLAAVLFPVFASARERGRRTACLSNERQIGMAMLQYVADNEEACPFGPTPSAGTGWAGACLPYIKDTRLFQCPDDGTRADASAASPAPFVVSYAFNCNLGGVRYSSPKLGSVFLPAAALSVLTAPAKTVMLFEASDNITQMGYVTSALTGAPVDFDSPSGNTATRPGIPSTENVTFLLGGGGQFPVGDDGKATRYATGDIGGRVLNGGAGSTPRHAGGANYAACDGHALWLSPDHVSGGADAAASDCAQGTDTAQPPDCHAQGNQNAAGAANGKYALTFSTR